MKHGTTSKHIKMDIQPEAKLRKWLKLLHLCYAWPFARYNYYALIEGHKWYVEKYIINNL